MTIKFLVLAVSVFSLVACSEMKAIKRTGDVPDKMDQTNQKMDQTNKQIDQTNKKMDQTNEKIDQTNSKMDSTNEKIDETNSTLQQTKSAIHDQQVLIPLEEMLKPENWNELAPVPFKLMPYGKKLAEAATADELINIFYLYMKEVSEVGADTDINMAGESIYRTQAQAESLFHEKIAKLTILQIIAGFASENTVNEIVNHEVLGDGAAESKRFQDAARAFMCMRARFINDVLVRNSVMSGTLTNIGMAEDAIKYVDQLDAIAVNADASAFKYKLSGTINYKNDKGEVVNYPFEFSDELPSGQDAPKAWWGKIKAQLDNLSALSNQSTQDNEASRWNEAEQKVDQHVRFWSARDSRPVRFR